MNDYRQASLPAQQMQNNWAYYAPQQQWQTTAVPPQPQPQPESQILAVSVNSAEEAERFPVAPGRTIFLIDYTNRQFWLKRKDEMGLISTFIHHTFKADSDTTEDTPCDTVTRQEFDEVKSTLDELMKQLK